MYGIYDLKNKFLQDPLQEKGLPLFARNLASIIIHQHNSQYQIVPGYINTVYLLRNKRRSMFKSNSAMEAGKKTGEALIRTFADTVYKISPTTKKVAPTTNEKISLDNAIQEQLEYFKEYEPADDKDADKKFKYLEEVPEVTRAAHTALTELGVASHVTCERQISIPTDNVEVSFRFFILSFPLLVELILISIHHLRKFWYSIGCCLRRLLNLKLSGLNLVRSRKMAQGVLSP